MAKNASKTPNVNKSEFIRSQPATMSARDVVALAAEQGFKLTEGFVHSARSAAKRKAQMAGQSRPAGTRTAAGGGGGATSGDETTFRKLVVKLGISRARELVAEVESKLVAVVEGW